MRSARKEIKGLDRINMVAREQHSDVTCLSGGITGQINNARWSNFEEAIN